MHLGSTLAFLYESIETTTGASCCFYSSTPIIPHCSTILRFVLFCCAVLYSQDQDILSLTTPPLSRPVKTHLIQWYGREKPNSATLSAFLPKTARSEHVNSLGRDVLFDQLVITTSGETKNIINRIELNDELHPKPFPSVLTVSWSRQTTADAGLDIAQTIAGNAMLTSLRHFARSGAEKKKKMQQICSAS